METLIGVLICLGVLAVAAVLLTAVLHYSFAQVRKSMLALTIFLGAALAYVLHFDPSFGVALEALVGGVFAVIGVFAAPQFSEQDLSKSLTFAVGALFSVLKFLGIENASLETEIYTFLGLVVAVIAVWWTGNAHRTPIKR